MDGDIDRAKTARCCKTMKPFAGRCAGPPLTLTLILGVLDMPEGQTTPYPCAVPAQPRQCVCRDRRRVTRSCGSEGAEGGDG
eukprot:6195025-Prymnesium_polylepis.1